MKKRFAAAVFAAIIGFVFLFAQGPVQKVRLWDTNLSHSLLLNWNENDTAGRTLNFLVAAASRSFTISGDSYIDQDVRIAATPYHAGLYLSSASAAPFLKLINASDTARDPIIQFAVGATPVTKFTMGVDDDTSDEFKISAGSALGTTDRIRIDSVGAVLIGAGTKSDADTTMEVFATTFPVIRGHRTTNWTDIPAAGIDFLHEATGNMADGFGGAFLMSIKDATSAIYYAASSDGIRDGADNKGGYQLSVYENNIRYKTARLSHQGTFHVGSTSGPVSFLTTQAASMEGGIQLMTDTAPTGSVANAIQFYSTDFAAGNACPYFRTEGGTVIGLNQGLLTTDGPSFDHLHLTVAVGTAPLVITSTTAVSNLNADLWDGYQFSDYLDQAVKTTSGPSLDHLHLTIAIGTAPLVVTSTTVVSNLNADLLDGSHAAAFELALGNPGTSGFVLSSTDAGVRSWIAQGGGADHFVDLLDVPAAYAGAGGYVVKVKGDASGLEFVAGGAGVTSFNDLDDVPASYVGQEGLFIRVNATANGLEYAASGAPTDAKYIVQEVNAGLSAEQSLGALVTGIVKNTTTGSVGVLSIATATDIPQVAISTTTITATGATNWNKVAGARFCLVRIWAAGGSGGRGGSGDGGGGGGGGAYIEKIFDYADLSDPVSVTIGTGGAAQTSDDTAGNVGGNTTFGTYLTAYGGGGGGAVTSVYGGGGGGGTTSAGTVGSGTGGGVGGGPAGGYYTATTGVGRHSAFGGGCGGGAGPIAAGDSGWGGGGGGGGTATSGNGPGGNSLYGGGGGGGGSDTGAGSAGGTSLFGGAGGAGAPDVNAGPAGSQPAGGGGGSENANSGAGGDGKAVIISF